MTLAILLLVWGCDLPPKPVTAPAPITRELSNRERRRLTKDWRDTKKLP